MAELTQSYLELEKCIVDILSIIKPGEDDQSKRKQAIEEVVNAVSTVDGLHDAVVKPYGSFVSKLYSNSGDLDLSLELPDNYDGSNKTKVTVLRKIMQALENKAIAVDANIIASARIPVLQYVSYNFGISCDISVNNYHGWIKSKVLYWISTMDWRFASLVLLVKEWAKAQHINDPKNGTLNSYTICLLVLFHLQTCKPQILPPLNLIYDSETSGGSESLNEESLDKICQDNISKVQCEDMHEKKNDSSLSQLLASFFKKFRRIGDDTSDYCISTYSGELIRRKTKSSWCLFVLDPFEKEENTARTIASAEFDCITKAFACANDIIFSDKCVDRNALLLLLCTPKVGSKLGVRNTAGRDKNSATDGHKLEKCPFEREKKEVLEKCIEDILSAIKPTKDDHDKRKQAIEEVVNAVSTVDCLEGAAVTPYGSFVSKLYTKSGGLDLSLWLPDKYDFPASKEVELHVLRELMKALQKEGVAADIKLVSVASVPAVHYVTNNFGVYISIDNYYGQLKSTFLYSFSRQDERFVDLVLLVKEWAKAQNINDPKTGTLDSYSICLLVLFHLQTCQPSILPKVCSIYSGDPLESGRGCLDERMIDWCSMEKNWKFESSRCERNRSPLSHLLVTFFEKFCDIGTYSNDVVISTSTAEVKRYYRGKTRTYCLFVEDPFATSWNASRAVDVQGLHRIAGAFTRATNTTFSYRRMENRDELVSLLCTPELGSKLAHLQQPPSSASVGSTPVHISGPSEEEQYADKQRRWYTANQMKRTWAVPGRPRSDSTCSQSRDPLSCQLM